MTFKIRVPVAYAFIQSGAAAFPKLGKHFFCPPSTKCEVHLLSAIPEIILVESLCEFIRPFC